QAVKAINPSIQVIGPAWSDFVRTESLAMTNSLNQFDGWSWHDYNRGYHAPDQDYGTPDWVPILETDRLRYYFGNFATQKPLLVDELGLYGHSALGTTNATANPGYNSNIDWYRGMCRAIKTTVMYRACGAAAIIPHIFTGYGQSPDSNLELFGWDMSATNVNSPRGPHPKTSAFLMTCYWLNGATFAGYRNPGTNAFLYAWQLADNSSLVVAWAPEGQTVPLQANALVTTDIYGRTNSVTALSEEPVLFHSNDPDALTLLSAVRSNIVGVSNFAPVMDPLPTESIVAGQQLQLTVSATDADNDPITFSTTALPLGATFDPVTHTLSWTPATGAPGPYTATFVATDSQGATDSISTTITVLGNLFDGLLAHWKLDESAGTVAADSAGTNNGTLTGFNFTTNSGHVSGILSNALSFDGVDDFVALDGNQIDLTNNFTVTAWLYPRNASTAGAFISVRSFYLASGFRFFIYNNSVFVQGQTTVGWQASTFGAGAIQNGNWYHVAVVYDDSFITVYVNGVSLGSADWGGDMIMNTNSFSRIGSDATEGADYFNGVIDDVMLFERALTSPQIETLHQSANQPLTVSRLQGTLNFAQTNADTCTVKGSFALPSDYNFSNKVVTLNIGGAETSFTLDSKGRGLSGLNRFNKPSYNKTTGLWTFNAILRNGSWRNSWAAHGLIDASILKPGVPVTLPVNLAIDNQSFAATPSRQYTSQAGKSGIAR
ncbi:MAG TPA: LamG-like jellyroll fold domain-containing protein, partial [Verrucomicrobiae bacterium]|nr:LamG-like jellyroll fold domain-containing protein [Verrucomicrobiae bacterium]